MNDLHRVSPLKAVVIAPIGLCLNHRLLYVPSGQLDQQSFSSQFLFCHCERWSDATTLIPLGI